MNNQARPLGELMQQVADAGTDPHMKRIFDENVVSQLITEVMGVPMREGLVETPARVVKAWKKWTSGYDVDCGA